MTKLPAIATVAVTLIALQTAFAASKPSAFYEETKTRTAHVSILAISSKIHQQYAGNREIYLADITLGKDGGHQFVQLVDRYPEYSSPIRPSVLRDRTMLSMRVTRDTTCDAPAAKIFLPPTERNIYDGSVRDTLAQHPTDLIPCFRIDHTSTRILKK